MAAEHDTKDHGSQERGTTEAGGAEAAEVTVDGLAAEFMLPVSTVRLYQNRRILPPPTKRGRVGYYGDVHRERLRTVAALQDRGFSLAAIKETIDSWEAGASLGQLIGATTAVPGLANERLVTLSASDLAQRFPGGLTSDHVRRAIDLGMVRVVGSNVLCSETFLDASATMSELGLSVDEILDEFTSMKEHVVSIVDGFVALFDDRVWQGFVAAGQPGDQLAVMGDEVSKLVLLAKQIVSATLDDELVARTNERLESLRNEAP